MKPVIAKERVRCRPIAISDLDATAALLSEGFKRPKQEFLSALNTMSGRDVPEGAQRYGYCLDTGQRLVGAILLIAAERQSATGRAVFCNVASWYVVEEFRAYAQLIVSIALKHKDFTYTNVTPAPHTWDIVEKQGYTKYCNGLFFALAALKPACPDVVIERFDAARHSGVAEFEMLMRHQALGCDVVVAREGERLDGMVFRRYRIRGGRLPLPAMFTLHAPDRARLLTIAGNLGRYFLAHHLAPALVMDADGPVEGLVGMFTARRGRKYFKGPHRPAMSDLADTEYAIFGV
jgi:hypothetical protein